MASKRKKKVTTPKPKTKKRNQYTGRFARKAKAKPSSVTPVPAHTYP
jgi:hypothetical protein